jgi:Flp pilus assembly protein TadB
MNSVALIGLIAILVGISAFEWRRMRSHPAQIPEWRREMKQTPWRDRRRIARAVRRGERLDDPREARLAAGMAEQQQKVNRSMRLLPKANLIFGVALVLIGLLATALRVALLGALIIALALIERTRRDRQRRRLEHAEWANREQAGLEAGQPGQ